MRGPAIPARGRRTAAVSLALALAAGACSSGSHHAAPPSTNASATSTTTTPSTAPATPAPTNPKIPTFTIPASIPHDCSVDVTSAIQQWIDSVPDNATLRFLPNGCYRVDETLTIENRHRLLVDGRHAELRAETVGDRTRQELVVSGGSDITVRDLVVRGANPNAGAVRGAYHVSLEAQHAFQISGVTNATLDHVEAYDLYGDFVYIGPADGRPSNNVTVSNSTFERSGRQGVSVTDAENVTIKGNTIGGAPQSIFDIEPNTPSEEARSIRIIDNVTGGSGGFWFANKGARGNVGDIVISGNRMRSASGGLIFVYASGGRYRGPFVISDNRFIASDKTHDEHSSGAMFFTRANDITIRGNVVTFPRGAAMPAVELRDSHRVQVSRNTFTDAGMKVLSTQGSSDLHLG